jgi:hypothetical protein
MDRGWTGRTGTKKIERKDETAPVVSPWVAEDSASARDEVWWRSAYRQGLHPLKALAEPPVDEATQLVLEGVEGLAEGRFFRGPDHRFRPRTFDALEDYDQTEIRRRAIAASNPAVLERLQEGDPHPGEEAAIKRLRDLHPGAERLSNPATNDNRPSALRREDRPTASNYNQISQGYDACEKAYQSCVSVMPMSRGVLCYDALKTCNNVDVPVLFPDGTLVLPPG